MHVEFFGIPRQRAGLSEVQIEATTLGQLLGMLDERFPLFGDLMTARGLHPSVSANLNGERFVSDLATALTDDDHLLILSADVGG